jgi:hypothetical protein
MTTNTDNKLKNLLDIHVPETVLLASWLEKMGISHDLQKYYRRSGWLKSLGTGAYKRPKESVRWQGGLYSLQTQAKLSVHAGGITALALHGFTHYIRLGDETVYLFSSPKTNLPKWFSSFDWNTPIKLVKTSQLPSGLGLTDFQENNFAIRIASPERAIFECLFQAPNELDLVECYQMMEGLTNLRPKLLQELLERCTSIKVKRLFLYMADKARHQWLTFIDQAKISLGEGDRSVVKAGVYVSKYRISVPKELVEL